MCLLTTLFKKPFQKIIIKKIIYFSALLLLSCNSGKNWSDYKTKFHEREKEFHEIVGELRSKELDALIKKEGIEVLKTAAPGLYKQIKDNGVKEIIAYQSVDCPSELQYDFKINSPLNKDLHLGYNTCDSTTIAKTFYKSDKLGNEFWGIDKNWYLWVDVTFPDNIHGFDRSN